MTTVLQLSDTHLPRIRGTEVMGDDPDARLATVLDAWRRSGESADLVIHTGDVTDDEAREGAQRVFAALAPLGVPVLATGGNHDDPAFVRDVFGDATTAQTGAWRIVTLPTAIPSEIHGRVDVDAAVAALDAVDARPTVVALHHPPHCRSTNAWFRLEGADDLLGMLAQRPHVRAVISGHLHDAFDLPGPDGLRLLGGPSVLAAIEHHGEHFEIGAPGAPAGARILRLADDGSFTTELLVA